MPDAMPVTPSVAHPVDGPAQSKAEGAWDASTDPLASALGERIQRWALQLGAAAPDAQAAADVARLLSRATQDGHACVVVDDPNLRQALMRTRLAVSSLAPTPADASHAALMVVDNARRVYWARSFDDERRLARRLIALKRVPMPPASPSTRAHLHALFQPGPTVDRQMLAAALALVEPLVIVSGGPGTGKTTTLAKLLACAWQQAPTLRVGLAAPTGKAAARMTESLRASVDVLPAAAWQHVTTATVHAWLALHPATGRPRFHADNPWPLDLMVIDEASMLDVTLARQCLEALPAHARLVLLGDRDQLTAVQPGNVFADLTAPAAMSSTSLRRLADLTGWRDDALAQALQPFKSDGEIEPFALQDNVIRLTHSYRFDASSGVGALARAVREGASTAAILVLQEAKAASELQWTRLQNDAPPPSLDTMVALALEPYAHAVQVALRADAQGDTSAREAALQVAFEALDAFRLLSAVHEGPCGTRALNRRVALWLEARLALPSPAPALPMVGPAPSLQAGHVVMVTRNDAVLGVHNGQIGVVLPPHAQAPTWRVALQSPMKVWPLARLPALESAMAMSVHKSQGSEFAHAALVLPSPWQRPCTRELLYTAITRAKKQLTLIADEASLRMAIDTPTVRHSGLRDRLRDNDVLQNDVGLG